MRLLGDGRTFGHASQQHAAQAFHAMNARMAVCAATLAAGQGGIARVARMSVSAIAGAGHEVSVVSYLDDAPAPFAEVRTSMAARGSKLRFAALCHWTALWATHCLYDSAGIARAHPGLPGMKRPYAVWIHGLEAWEGMRADYARAIRRADLVFANSQYTLDRYERNHGALRAGRACWLATEQDEPPRIRADFSGVPTVLIVGRLDATEGWKGHRHILACWPRVVATLPSARLIIAGGGTGLEDMRARARENPAASSIDVLGFVTEAEIPALFKRAHVFAMPSRQEGFGIAYVEAMRFGLPVIASVHDAGQEINVDGETGFNVDLTRKDELGDRLIDLLRERDWAAMMGEAGFQRWRHHFRYSRFAARFLDHWRDFASAHPKRGRPASAI